MALSRLLTGKNACDLDNMLVSLNLISGFIKNKNNDYNKAFLY